MIDFLIVFSCMDITVLDYIHPYSLPLAIFIMLVSAFFLHTPHSVSQLEHNIFESRLCI